VWQACVDDEANFLYIACRSAGSVHDSQAWQATHLSRLLEVFNSAVSLRCSESLYSLAVRDSGFYFE